MLSEVNRKKDLTRSHDKNPYTNRKFENQRTTQKRHKNFYYTTIDDRLRMVWLNRFTGTEPSH